MTGSIEVARDVVLAQFTLDGLKTVASAPAEVVRDRLEARLNRIFDAAQRKAAGRPLTPSSRVAHKVFFEGAITDEQVVADYLGGVIAAAGQDDDNATAVVAQIGRLSAHHLALHYLIYRQLTLHARRKWGVNLYDDKDAARIRISLAMRDLEQAVGSQFAVNAGSYLTTLRRELLIQERFRAGTRKGDNHWVYTVGPTPAGAELFLWGLGSQSWNADLIFDPNTRDLVDGDVFPGPFEKSRVTIRKKSKTG